MQPKEIASKLIPLIKKIVIVTLFIMCSNNYASYVIFCASDSNPNCPACYRPAHRVIHYRYKPHCVCYKGHRHHRYRHYRPIHHRVIYIETFCHDIDLDRRTADDVGSELQIN